MSFFDRFMFSYEPKCNNGIKHCEAELPSDKPVKENSKVLPPENLPKWITIEGYKAVDCEMNSFYGKHHFELNKTYTCKNENLIPCKNGFHFCTTLSSVCELFEPSYGKRYFRVQAVVPAHSFYDKEKKEWKTHPKNCNFLLGEQNYKDGFPPLNFSNFGENSKKYVAKEITLIEEIPYKEIKKYISYPFLDNEKNYRTVTNHSEYIRLLYQEWHKTADLVFSKSFAEYIFMEKIYQANNPEVHNSDLYIGKKVQEGVKIITALSEEKISQEFKVMLFLKELKI